METTFANTTQALGAYLPKFLAAVVILVLGWLVARVIGALVSAGLRHTNLDNRLAEWVAAGRSSRAIPIEDWVGKAVFYLLMVFVLVGFFEALGLVLVTEPLNRLLNQLFEFAPQLLGALALVLVAWLVAGLLRAIIRRGLSAANVDERVARQAGTRQPVSLTETIADTVYWLVFLLFLPAILNTLALQGLLAPVQGMIDEVLRFLPNIFTAALILAVGWFVARVVKGIVTNFLSALGTDTLSRDVGLTSALGAQSLSSVVGLVVYILILVPVVIAALDALSLQAVTGPTSNMLNTMLAALPSILAATLILVIAYITGRVVAALVGSLLAGVGFDSILPRLGLARQVSPGQRTPSETVGYLTFIAIMLVAAMEAARQLGFTVLGDLISRFMIFAGDVVLGLIILAIGLYLARVASAAVGSSGVAQAGTLAVATQVSIVVLAGAMALRQMGLANDIINLAFGLILGGIVLAAALAIGLGSREVAGREVDQLIRSIKAQNGMSRQIEAAEDRRLS
jgi:Conserved TM helix